jgi:hypothetical protein
MRKRRCPACKALVELDRKGQFFPHAHGSKPCEMSRHKPSKRAVMG